MQSPASSTATSPSSSSVGSPRVLAEQATTHATSPYLPISPQATTHADDAAHFIDAGRAAASLPLPRRRLASRSTYRHHQHHRHRDHACLAPPPRLHPCARAACATPLNMPANSANLQRPFHKTVYDVNLGKSLQKLWALLAGRRRGGPNRARAPLRRLPDPRRPPGTRSAAVARRIIPRPCFQRAGGGAAAVRRPRHRPADRGAVLGRARQGGAARRHGHRPARRDVRGGR